MHQVSYTCPYQAAGYLACPNREQSKSSLNRHRPPLSPYQLRIVHSKEFGQLSNEIVPRPSAIPWEVFAGDRRLLDLGREEFARGRALILYPEGLPRLEGNETEFINSGTSLGI